MIKTTFLALLASLALIMGCVTTNSKNAQQTDNGEESRFVNFTDLHFTPYQDSSLVFTLADSSYEKWDSIFQASPIKGMGSYGEETSYELLSLALQHMKKSCPDPDFIIIAGDFICHDFEAIFQKLTKTKSNEEAHQFLTKTMQFLASKIESTFPNSAILPALGNNDAYCGDYQIEPAGKYLQLFAQLFTPTIDITGQNDSIANSIEAGGYYFASNPKKSNHKIIALNSIIFTPKYQSDWYDNFCQCPTFNQDSLVRAQLSWFEEKLELCSVNGDNVWIITHVPPGIDVYSTMKNKTSGEIVSYWKDEYAQAYKKIINKYSSLIKVTLVGHTHMDDFKLIYNNDVPEAYIHITPSITPVFNNNPGYQVVSYSSSDFTFTNYKSYYVDLESDTNKGWQTEYDFTEVFGANSFTPNGIDSLFQILKTDSLKREKYFLYFPSGSKDGAFVNASNWDWYQCGIDNILVKGYSDCHQKLQ